MWLDIILAEHAETHPPNQMQHTLSAGGMRALPSAVSREPSTNQPPRKLPATVWLPAPSWLQHTFKPIGACEISWYIWCRGSALVLCGFMAEIMCHCCYLLLQIAWRLLQPHKLRVTRTVQDLQRTRYGQQPSCPTVIFQFARTT